MSGGPGTGVSPAAARALAEDPVLTLRMRASVRNLRLLRRLVREAATDAGCGEACARDIVIAIDEACQNVIRHGYGGDGKGDLIVEVRRDDQTVVFNLIDFAEPVDPKTVKPRDLDEIRPGGLGTHFISECMDHWSFTTPPPGAGNCLSMTKRIT